MDHEEMAPGWREWKWGRIGLSLLTDVNAFGAWVIWKGPFNDSLFWICADLIWVGLRLEIKR